MPTSEQGDQPVLPAVLADGGDSAEESSEDAGEGERRAGQQQGRRQPVGDFVQDRAVENVGAAKVAVQNIADPDQVLLGKRAVESELGV